MKFKNKIAVGYTVIFTMIGQTVTLSAMGVWAGMLALATPFEKAMAAQDKFEQIKQKYNTNDPNNNRGDDSKLNQTLTKYQNQTSSNPNKENEIIQKYYLNPQTQGTVDLSGYGNLGANAKNRIESSVGIARDISKAATTPTTTSTGAIKSNYNKSGVELKKDDSGNYNATLDQSNVTEQTTGLDEYTSAEMNHSQTTFEADQHYGDESQFYASGTTKINSLKTGKASDATAYQTIQAIQNDNTPPEINPKSSLFNFGFSEVSDAVNGTGDWMASCTDETFDVSREFTSTQSTNHLCMEPAASNDFYCEVERIYNIAHIVQSVSGNVSVSACGDGCVEITFNPGKKGTDFYDGGKCTVFDESAVVELNPNLQIDSVTVLDSDFDDHGIIKVNGNPGWSVINGVYGSSGTWEGPCERSKNWVNTSFQGNMENIVKDEFIKMNGVLGLKMLTRVGDGGGGYFKFRIKMSDPKGEPWGVTYKQHPEGCYDAVAPELKSVNGLSGLELGSAGGDSSGSTTYMCTQEGPDMICGDPLGYNPSTCSSVSHNNYMCTKSTGSTETQGNYPYSFCRFDSYTNLEVGDGNLPTSMLASVPPWYEGDKGNKTWKVNLDGFKCDPTGGVDYCVITKRVTDEELAMGLEHEKECYSWGDIENLENQCKPLIDDPQCTEVEKTCAEGWLWKREGQEDICFAYTTEYQCKEEISHTVTSQVTENTCAATLPCIGGDCDTSNQEVNDQFADALAMATVIQHMEDGMNCEDPSDPSTCTIFEGEGKFCSWEPSGLGNDCCEAPDGVDIYEYAKAAYGMLQADAFVAGLDGTSNAVVGGYQSLREPIANAATTAGEAVSDAYSAFTSTFTDAASTAAGNAAGEVVDTSGTVMDVFSDQAMDELKQQTMNYMRDALPDALSDALFDTAADGAAGATGDAVLSEGASQAVAVIGYVYAAYMVYQYIKLALNLLTACHEYEMDMGVRIATKQCIKVGKKYCAEDALGVCYLRRQDYCCYDSILSRIIMEQASPMLGHDLEQYTEEKIDGSKIRSCPGLTPDQLSNMDWNKIDLSEWINIMIESGIADFDQDMEKLTGSGRMINNEGRENIVERTTQRAADAELTERAIETRSIINADDIDCSYVPRPLACYFNGGN